MNFLDIREIKKSIILSILLHQLLIRYIFVCNKYHAHGDRTIYCIAVLQLVLSIRQLSLESYHDNVLQYQKDKNHLKFCNIKHLTKQQVDSGSQSHATIAIVHIVVQFWKALNNGMMGCYAHTVWKFSKSDAVLVSLRFLTNITSEFENLFFISLNDYLGHKYDD